MTEGRGDANKDVKPPSRVTITEAATLLNVHPNTVRNRVKAGVYNAEKVSTEHGFTWMIDRDSLVNTPLPKASQVTPSQAVNLEGPQPLEVVQELLRPFVEDLGRVREELGAERVRREQAERERDELAAKLAALEEARELPIEPADEAQGHEERPFTEEAQEAAESRSWWRRFFGFE
jgi:hypothetical protein